MRAIGLTAVPLAGNSERAATTGAATPELDATDLLLLQRLAVNARLSVRALARDIGMSAPAVADRIARLERTGVIRGYRIDLDYAALAFSMTVYVAITCAQSRSPRELLGLLCGFPEVEQAELVTGSMDLIVRIRVRNHAHMRDLLFDRILPLNGVSRTETFISLDSMPEKNFGDELLSSLRRTAACAGSAPP